MKLLQLRNSQIQNKEVIDKVEKKIVFLKRYEALTKQAFNEKRLYENIKILKVLKNSGFPIEFAKLNQLDKIFRNLEELDQKVEIINNQKISIEEFLFDKKPKFIDIRKLEQLLFESPLKAFKRESNDYF